jgi:hypothetical protein
MIWLDGSTRIVGHGDYTAENPHPIPSCKLPSGSGWTLGYVWPLEVSHNGARSASSAGMLTVMVRDPLGLCAFVARICMKGAQPDPGG